MGKMPMLLCSYEHTTNDAIHSHTRRSSPMKTGLDLNRRQFLLTAAVAASGWPAVGVAQPPSAGGQTTPGGGRATSGQPKIGCLSWCFHSLTAGADPEPA